MEREAERARSFYRAAWASYPPVDARSLVPAEIMGRIYFALLEEIERRRYRVLGERVTLARSPQGRGRPRMLAARPLRPRRVTPGRRR